jgi:hypothetical protein
MNPRWVPALSQYRDCKICKVKQYNADKSGSQKKKIIHRGHHPICPVKPRPAQSPMMKFVQRTFAVNIRLNNAPIERVSILNLTNQVPNSQVQIEFPHKLNKQKQLYSKTILSFPGRPELLSCRLEASPPHSSALLLQMQVQ